MVTRQFKLILLAFFLLNTLGWVFSQSPAPASTKLSDHSHDRLVAAYAKAILLQSQAQSAQQLAQGAIAEWNALNAQVIKEEKLPEGTTFAVDLTKSGEDEVRVVPPQPKPPAASAAKKSEPTPPAPTSPPVKK